VNFGPRILDNVAFVDQQHDEPPSLSKHYSC